MEAGQPLMPGAEMRRVLVSEYGITGLRHLNACGLERVVLPERNRKDVEEVETELLEGLEQELVTDASYYLVWKEDRARDESVCKLRDWILQTFSESD